MEINQQTAELYNDALFIVEIAHKGVAPIWYAEDKSEFIEKCQRCDTPKTCDTSNYLACCDYINRGLKELYILNLQEAIDYVQAFKHGYYEFYNLLKDLNFITPSYNKD